MRSSFEEELGQIQDLAGLERLKTKYLGKSSVLKQAFNSLREVSAEERPEIARLLNEAKGAFEAAIAARKERLEEQSQRERLDAEWVDTSMPGLAPRRGALHPVNLVERRCLAVLRQLGFELVDGPEVELEFYNFDALNIPKHHSARDLQDTFFVTGGLVLRSHTTSVQARILEQRPAAHQGCVCGPRVSQRGRRCDPPGHVPPA